MNPLLPLNANNHYQGPLLAKWVLFIIFLLSLSRSFIHMFAFDSGAHIASIPIQQFSVNGANTVVLMMSLWGSSQFLMSLVYLVVLWRYQAFIPLMYLFIFLEYSLRMLLIHLKPIVINGIAPGHVMDYVMIPLSIGFFILSLRTVSNENRNRLV